MADKKAKKKMSATEKWAAKNKKKPTVRDVPGSGGAYKAGKAIQLRHKMLNNI